MVDNFGQLFITGLKGTTLLPEEVDFIKNEKLGGVYLSSVNFEAPAQLAELVNSIQKHRDEYPLFISVDQEGGRGSRFKTHFTQFPSMLDLASLNSPKLVFEVHEVMAKELNACGVNLLYSPCCDILTNPDNKFIGDRSYGRDAQTVEKYISAAIRGVQTNGVLACAKHFPGHGDTARDPHFDLPLLKTDQDELRRRELVPFIKASRSRVEFMLMGHLLMDALDDKLPASLSPRAYEFLRQETKFSKITITDALDLRAITDRFGRDEAALGALAAGADILRYTSLEEASKALSAVREAVRKKVLKKESMIEKLARIERCKKEHFATYQPIYIPKITEAFSSAAAKALVEQFRAIRS